MLTLAVVTVLVIAAVVYACCRQAGVADDAAARLMREWEANHAHR